MIEKNALQFTLYMTIHGMESSRQISLIIVVVLVVVDNSKRMTILVFIHSSLFALHQKNMFDDDLKPSMDEEYLRKNVAKTCLSLYVGWMNKLEGVEGVDKCELVEESQKEEYILYVIDLWKKASTLSHRLYSRGEQDTNKFLGRKESKKTNHVESRLGQVKNTAKMICST